MEETCQFNDDSRCQQVNKKRKLEAQQCFLPKCLKRRRRKEKKKKGKQHGREEQISRGDQLEL